MWCGVMRCDVMCLRVEWKGTYVFFLLVDEMVLTWEE